MGFYSGSRLYQETYSNVPEVTLEEVMRDDSILPSEQEDLIEASLNIIENIQENQNRFFQHIGVSELDYYDQHGEELIYTESVLGDIVDTIKKFLMKIWERIKGLFKRFIMIIDSYSKNDKDFAKKYQKEIFSKSGDTSDFTFKGYKWDIDNSGFQAAMTACSTKSDSHWKTSGERTETQRDRYDSKESYEKNVDKESDAMETLRGEIYNAFTSKHKVSGNTTLTSEEFRKEVHELFRGGETEKEELDSKDLDVHNMYNHLIQSQQDKKNAKTAFDTAKKSIDQDIKELERLHNTNIKDSPGTPTDKKYTEAELNVFWDSTKNDWKDDAPANVKATANVAAAKTANLTRKETDDEAHTRNDLRSKNLAYFAKYSRVTKECLLTINSELLTAMKERSRQYKACLIAYVHYRPSSESAMTESYWIGKDKNVGGSIFSGISFV